jgi:hypothetical protein
MPIISGQGAGGMRMRDEGVILVNPFSALKRKRA